LKENEAEGLDDADELNLSSSRMRGSRSARRVVMDSVELVTPSKRRVAKFSQRDTISPTPALFKQGHVDCEDLVARQPLLTPSKKRNATAAPPRTPSKAGAISAEPLIATSPIRLPRVLPPHLYLCLNAQKRAILDALQNPPDFNIDKEEDEHGPLANTIASKQLFDLLVGTVTRGEGNSCLILGPRGSGKTRVRTNILSAI